MQKALICKKNQLTLTCESSFAQNFILKDQKLKVERKVVLFQEQLRSLLYGKAIEEAKKSVAKLFSESYQ